MCVCVSGVCVWCVCVDEVTMEEVDQALRAGELLIILVVLIMWAGNHNHTQPHTEKGRCGAPTEYAVCYFIRMVFYLLLACVLNRNVSSACSAELRLTGTVIKWFLTHLASVTRDTHNSAAVVTQARDLLLYLTNDDLSGGRDIRVYLSLS